MCLGGRTEASQPRSIVQHPLYSPFRMIFPRQILDKLRSRKAFFRPLPLVLIFGLMLTFSPLLGANGEKHRSEEHTSELQSQSNLVCRLLLEKKKGLRAAIAKGRHRGGPSPGVSGRNHVTGQRCAEPVRLPCPHELRTLAGRDRRRIERSRLA